MHQVTPRPSPRVLRRRPERVPGRGRTGLDLPIAELEMLDDGLRGHVAVAVRERPTLPADLEHEREADVAPQLFGDAWLPPGHRRKVRTNREQMSSSQARVLSRTAPKPRCRPSPSPSS